MQTPTRAEWLELRRLRKYAGGKHAHRKDKPRTRIACLREMQVLRQLLADRHARGPQRQAVHYRKRNPKLRT